MTDTQLKRKKKYKSHRDGSTLSTKDDLSVVLGEFDLSSANDEFDTNR